MGGCRYCYLSSTPASFNELGTELWKVIASQVNQLKVESIHVEGGETLEREDLPIILGALNKRSRITVFTNGAIPYNVKFAPFKDIGGLFFSIDGPPAIHSLMRGVDVTTILMNMAEFRRAGFNVKVRATLHRENIAFMKELVTMCNVQGITAVRFGEFMPIGRGKFLKDDFGLRTEDIRAALENFSQVALHYSPQIKLKLSLRGNYLALAQNVCLAPNLDIKFIPCFAGREQFSICHNGDVLLCSESYYPQCVGSVKEKPLLEILEKIPQPVRSRCNHGHTIISNSEINFE
jgi:MoaA/NifB/PqqE/SkfB family radical SAM enzyme